MGTMYIAVNRENGLQETFYWTPAGKLIIQGQPVHRNEWEIVQIDYKIVTDEEE